MCWIIWELNTPYQSIAASFPSIVSSAAFFWINFWKFDSTETPEKDSGTRREDPFGLSGHKNDLQLEMQKLSVRSILFSSLHLSTFFCNVELQSCSSGLGTFAKESDPNFGGSGLGPRSRMCGRARYLPTFTLQQTEDTNVIKSYVSQITSGRSEHICFATST